MKRKLVKCALRAYSELIRSDIFGPSGARPAQLPFLRSSPLSVMRPHVSKFSSPFVLEPLIAKPTRGELRSRLEVLEKKKRSVKRKPPSLPKGYPPARGKILKVGASSSPSFVVGAGDSLGRAAEPSLEVLPISVWSPTSRGTAPPLVMPDEVMGNCDLFEAAGNEDSLLSHVEKLLGLFPQSYAIPTSGRWMPCPLRRLWLFCFREPPLYVQVLSSIFFFNFSVLLADFLLLFLFGRWLLMRKAW